MKKLLAFAMATLLVLASFTFLTSAVTPVAQLTGTPSDGATVAAALDKNDTFEYVFDISGYNAAENDGYGIGALQVQITWDKDILEITNLITAPDLDNNETYLGYVPLTSANGGTLRSSGVTTAVNPESGKVSDGMITVAYTYAAPASNPDRSFFSAAGKIFKLQFKVLSDTKASSVDINANVISFGYVKSDMTPVELNDRLGLTLDKVYIDKAIPKLATPASLAWSTTSAQWGKVANASSYSIQLYKNGAAEGTAISYTGTADATQSFNLSSYITGAVGSVYTFTVTAIGDTTNYLTSDTSAKSTGTYTVPELPQLKTPTGLTWNTATAKWNEVTETTDGTAAIPVNYSIELFKNGTSQKTVSSTTASYDFTSDIVKGGSYTFKVTAVAGTSFRSSVQSSASAAKVVVAPALTAPTGLSWSGKTASWTAVANASSYTVQLKLNGTNTGSPIAVPTGTSVDLSDKMTAAGDYTFTVVAVGDGSDYSSSLASSVVATSVTVIPAPTGLAFTEANIATWTAVSNATKYTVKLLKNGTAAGVAIDVGSATQYDFSAQMKETGRYTFEVIAYGADPADYSAAATSASKTIKPEATQQQSSGIIFLPLYMRYTITYHANDGVVKNVIVTPGDRLNTNQTVAENTFTNGSKTFVEWNTKQDGKGKSYAAGDKILVNQNYHLFAIWK